MRVVIIGLGRFGTELLMDLQKRGDLHVTGVDVDEALIERVQARSEATVRLVRGFGARDLEDVGVDEDLDVAVVAIGEDSEAAQRWALALCRRGVGRVLARAQTDEAADVMERLLQQNRPRNGYEVIRPERDGALRVAARVALPGLIEVLEIGGEEIVARLRVPGALVGKSVAESGLRPKHRLNLLQVVRPREEGAPTHPEVNAELVFESADEIVVLGAPSAVDGLRELA